MTYASAIPEIRSFARFHTAGRLRLRQDVFNLSGMMHQRSDAPFFLVMGGLGGLYILLVVLLLAADVLYLILPRPGQDEPESVHPANAASADELPAAAAPRPSRATRLLREVWKPEIRYAIRLTLLSCTIAAILSVWIGTPLGYLLSRYKFPGRGLIDTIVDIPIVLPPLVLGLSLLILFHLPIGATAEFDGWRLEDWLRNELKMPITYQIPAVILAQFSVACAFAVRTMRVTFDQINPRAEDVARTLGCTRGGAFLYVALPQATKGLITAFTISWARSLGEFGPILVFAGATRMRTEVLSTTVFLELSVGNLEAAVVVSLLMVVLAMIVLSILRFLGAEMKT